MAVAGLLRNSISIPAKIILTKFKNRFIYKNIIFQSIQLKLLIKVLPLVSLELVNWEQGKGLPSLKPVPSASTTESSMGSSIVEFSMILLFLDFCHPTAKETLSFPLTESYNKSATRKSPLGERVVWHAHCRPVLSVQAHMYKSQVL